MMTHVSVENAGLQYAAVGHGMIYLQDGRVLVHIRPSERDPSRRTIVRRLESLATTGASQAVDCNREAAGKGETDADCARRLLAGHKAFYAVRYDETPEMFEFSGVAANEAGEAYEVKYESSWVGEREKVAYDSAIFDEGHTVVTRCPNPLSIHEYGGLFSGRGITLSCRAFELE
jgi:hypothetical protein